MKVDDFAMAEVVPALAVCRNFKNSLWFQLFVGIAQVAGR
jgi:hypothetical protein